MRAIGTGLPRIDGVAKVTGQAKYAAEFAVPGLLHGAVVSSTIARGRILAIDESAARAVTGVVEIITHRNRRRTSRLNFSFRDQVAPPGKPLRPLHDGEIHYNGQPVALVLAEDPQTARYAASLVTVQYAPGPHLTDPGLAKPQAYEPPRRRMAIGRPPPARGNFADAFAAAPCRLESEYRIPIAHHNPLEMHATTVIHEADGRLTIHDKTQGVKNTQSYVCWVFGILPNRVRVVSPYVGGAFGSGLRPQYQLFLAVLAARMLKRSVRIVLTRQQMFTFGYRPDTVQHVALAADGHGRLVAVRHRAVANTSRYEDYQENVVNWSSQLYACANASFDYRLIKTDLHTPIDMRAPGGGIGVHALECAMDELAFAAGIDPIQFRLLNLTDRDQADRNKPFSSRALIDCYEQGGRRFGWHRRSTTPCALRDGHELVGLGMASGIWEASQMPARARTELNPDGLVVSVAGADIGTGTYTILAQIAADTVGVPIERVTVKLGDSKLPFSVVEGGSMHAASVGSAVEAVCRTLRRKVERIAKRRGDDVQAVLREPPGGMLVRQRFKLPPVLDNYRYARFAHSAVFAEVRVDEELGIVRVVKLVNAVAAGRILNPLTARSQVIGGVAWGLSMALHEQTLTDHRYGRHMNHNLAEFHVPVNADVPDIDVIFVDEPNDKVNRLGIKGVGEIGVVGTSAAIANAIFNATGKRLRDLPITPDKVLAAS